METDTDTSAYIEIKTAFEQRWPVAKALTDARRTLSQALGQADPAAAERIEAAINEIDVAMEIVEVRLPDIVSGREHAMRLP